MRCNFDGERVGMIYGRTLCGGECVEEAAENFLSRYIGLFGMSRSELVRTRVIDPPERGGPAYVRFEQVYNGVPVEGASLTLVVSSQSGHAVKRVPNRCHPSPASFLRADTKTAEDARQIVDNAYDGEPDFHGEAVKVIWPLAERPVYAWRIDVSAPDRDSADERFFVSTCDGAILERRSLAFHFSDFTINVQGHKSVDDLRPPDCDTSDSPEDLWRIKVDLLETGGCSPDCETDSGYANENGEFTFTGVPPAFEITASMESEYFYLYDVGSPNDPYTEVDNWSDQDTSGTLTFDDESGRTRTTEQVNVYFWLHAARQWVEDLDSQYPGIGTDDPRPKVMCNSTTCIPGYHHDNDEDPGPKFTFGSSNVTCTCEGGIYRSYHSATVVAHEYGHRMHWTGAPNSSTPGVWVEAVADSFSSFVVDTPLMGKDICNCMSFGTDGRDIDDDYRWSELTTGSRIAGFPMSGAYWDMLSDLNDDDRSGLILLHSILQEPRGVEPDVALHAVLVDDDSDLFGSPADDNISNGSPNYEKINGAFRLHDLAAVNVPYVTIAWESGAPADPHPGDNVPVVVNVNPNSLVLPNHPLVLRYRINTGSGAGGAGSQTTMTYDQPSESYSATIDGSATDAGDVIDFYVRCETTSSTKKYTCFPPQAQFDFTSGMEERDFFSLVVTESAKSTALSTNLDTSPGWTVGTNEWTQGLPGFTQMGEQPGFDYPYDVLGVSPQHKCYYTGANGSVAGTWDLETTAFDLTDADVGVVSYALWFYARSATYQTHKFEVAIKDSNGSWTTVQTIDVPGGVARVRWIRQRAKLPNVPFGSGMMLRFRVIGSTTPKIEACVDEVRVWGVYEP